jgi:hypothetical protein
LATRGIPFPESTERLETLAFNLILALRVRSDRRVRNFTVPFEFDAFVFFAWPVVLPWYCYRSRGKRGLLYAAAVYGLALLPHLAASIASLFSRAGK